MAQVRYLILEVGKPDGFYLLMISLEKLFKWRVSPSGNRLPKAKKGQKKGLGEGGIHNWCPIFCQSVWPTYLPLSDFILI